MEQGEIHPVPPKTTPPPPPTPPHPTPPNIKKKQVDAGNHAVRRLDLSSRLVTTVAGAGTSGFTDGVGALATFNNPFGIALHPTATFALIVGCDWCVFRCVCVTRLNYFPPQADTNNFAIRRLDISSRNVTTFAGTGSYGTLDAVGTSATLGYPVGIAMDPTGTFALFVGMRGGGVLFSVFFT